MSDPTQELVQRKSLHEAAHAVVGEALGLRLLRVTIDEADGAGGVYFEPRERGAPPRAESMAMLFAGTLAEARNCVDEEATAASARYDMECINDIAAALSPPEDVPALVASARERAASLVDERWEDITWVAFVMREAGGTLTGAAVTVALKRDRRPGH